MGLGQAELGGSVGQLGADGGQAGFGLFALGGQGADGEFGGAYFGQHDLALSSSGLERLSHGGQDLQALPAHELELIAHRCCGARLCRRRHARSDGRRHARSDGRRHARGGGHLLRAAGAELGRLGSGGSAGADVFTFAGTLSPTGGRPGQCVTSVSRTPPVRGPTNRASSPLYVSDGLPGTPTDGLADGLAGTLTDGRAAGGLAGGLPDGLAAARASFSRSTTNLSRAARTGRGAALGPVVQAVTGLGAKVAPTDQVVHKRGRSVHIAQGAEQVAIDRLHHVQADHIGVLEQAVRPGSAGPDQT